MTLVHLYAKSFLLCDVVLPAHITVEPVIYDHPLILAIIVSGGSRISHRGGVHPLGGVWTSNVGTFW